MYDARNNNYFPGTVGKDHTVSNFSFRIVYTDVYAPFGGKGRIQFFYDEGNGWEFNGDINGRSVPTNKTSTGCRPEFGFGIVPSFRGGAGISARFDNFIVNSGIWENY
jgi:hypothetical protein